MKLIVGLGNPGAKYETTRHNIGFILVDALADRLNARAWQKKFQGEMTQVNVGGEDIFLLKPQTFMNLSGQSVGELARYYKIASKEILVIHDELDLAPMKVKLKRGGGHAGHNGLRSLHQHIGENYARLRVGIGHPGDKAKVSNYVLHPFSNAEWEGVEILAQKLPEALPLLLKGDEPKFFNALAPTPPSRPKKPKKEPLTQTATSNAVSDKPEKASSPFASLKQLFKP